MMRGVRRGPSPSASRRRAARRGRRGSTPRRPPTARSRSSRPARLVAQAPPPAAAADRARRRRARRVARRSASRRSASPPTRSCPRRRSEISGGDVGRHDRRRARASRSACSSSSRSALTSLIKDQLDSAFLFWLVEGCCARRSSSATSWLLVAPARPAPRVRVPRRRAQDDLLLRGRAAADAGERQRFSRLHPRCGTSFLLIVMIVAIFVFAPIGLPAWYWLSSPASSASR